MRLVWLRADISFSSKWELQKQDESSNSLLSETGLRAKSSTSAHSSLFLSLQLTFARFHEILRYFKFY